MKNDNYPIHFVDIETTHFDHTIGDIIEVCIWTSNDGGRTISNRFHTLIKPQNLDRAHPRALEVNGYKYNSHRWTNAPTFGEMANEIHRILNYGIIVGHNVNFDWTWLDHHVRAAVDKKISWRKLDTQALVWVHIPTQSASMDKLRDLLGWSRKNAHTATKDVEDMLRLFQMMVHTSIGYHPNIEAIKTHVDVVKARGDDHVYLQMGDVEAMIKMIEILSKNDQSHPPT